VKRTTVHAYDADLELARAVFDERSHFLYSGCGPEIEDQIRKAIDDALNSEWQRGISIGAWVERAMTALSLGRRQRMT
jgi:hypothetical protein